MLYRSPELPYLPGSEGPFPSLKWALLRHRHPHHYRHPRLFLVSKGGVEV